MLTQFQAVCPHTQETALFVYDVPLDAYLCTCSRCNGRRMCRAAIARETVEANPDGDTAVSTCHCRLVRGRSR